MVLTCALTLAAELNAAVLAADGPHRIDPKLPRPVKAEVDGYKVLGYGEFDIYSVSPTYDETVTVQRNNGNPWKKIVPKKSWEIKSNLIGLTPTRSPSSHAAELQPFATPYFVDGNAGTAGFAGRPVGDPSITRAWLRIDLPRPMRISAVALREKPDGGGMPANFDVRIFNWDLWQRRATSAEEDRRSWQTVYKVEGNVTQAIPRPGKTAPAVYELEGKSRKGEGKYLVCRFEPVTAREVWLTSPDDFLLAAFEVLNEAGNNVALISKGCGATVSRERHLLWLSEETQASLWQTYYDLGIKWVRENYYLTPLLQPYVQRDGRCFVDPYLDHLITEARDCGIEVCLTLSPDGTDKGIDYVRFMLNHFKDRVRYYEIFNEFYNQDSYGKNKKGPVDLESTRYVQLALPVAKIIREVDPKAKVILCGPCPLVADWILACLSKGMAGWVDVLSWHPYSFPQDTDDDYAPEELDRPRSVWAPPEVKTYADSVDYLRKEAEKLGFRGTLMANEAGAYAIHNNRTSNLIAAKYLARSAVLHTWLQVPLFWNETTSLMRPAWQPFWGNHGPYLKPAYSYYVLRSLCTILDGAHPDHVPFEPSSPMDKLEKYSFSLPNGGKLLALWIREKSRKHRFEDYEGMTADMRISDAKAARIVGIDLVNGREQELNFSVQGKQLMVPGTVLKDYPVFLRLEQ